MPTATVPARVRLPGVVLPPGDPAAVRRQGTLLAAAADALGQVAWRLQADKAAMQAAQRWCGTASTAYQGAVADHSVHLSSAGQVLRVAGQTCVQYAQSLDQAQGRALQAIREVDRLARERDELAEAWQRYEAERASALAALPTPVQAGELIFGSRAAAAELDRLQTWGDAIGSAAVRVAGQAQAADQMARTAAQAASRVFDGLASLTTAARAAAARRQHDALVAAGVLPAEDGSLGSRVTGLLDGLGDDITGPLTLVGGLLGVGGHIGDSWSQLGRGMGHAVTHPGDLLGTVLDKQDFDQGDWGHWVGSVGPGVLLSTGSGGTYAVARAVRSAELLAASARVADELRRAQELVELADWTQFYYANGGRLTSRLVPGGGLSWHEAVGGHALERHVGLDQAALRARVLQYRLRAASSFADRYEAEQLVAEAMDRSAADIAKWLGTDEPVKEFHVHMRQVVGVTVRKNSSIQEATRIRLVLVRAPDSALGYFLLTALPQP